MSLPIVEDSRLDERGSSYRLCLTQYARQLRRDCRELVARSREQRADSRQLSITSARLQRASWRPNGSEYA